MEPKYSFVSADNANVVRVIASSEEDTDDDLINHFAVLKYDRSSRQWDKFDLPWDACSIVTRRSPASEVLVLNPEGLVGRGYGGFREENVVPVSAKGPEEFGVLREIRIVADRILSVGMSRQVYADVGGNSWSVLHTPAMTARQSLMQVTGFNSIHGLSMQRLIAVGMGGEIWSYAQQIWRQADSPTNLALHRVLVLSEDHAIAVGQAGLVLVLERDTWREAFVVEDGADVWGLCQFNDKIYVATQNAVYVANSSLSAVSDVTIKGADSFGYLDAADGVLWSSGSDDIAFSVDGKKWQVITP